MAEHLCFTIVALFLVLSTIIARGLVGETAGVDAGVLFGVGGTFFGVTKGGAEVA